jgi:hypothetical protein
MIEKNSYGKAFGPVGSSAGVMIMVFGICAAYFNSLSRYRFSVETHKKINILIWNFNNWQKAKY